VATQLDGTVITQRVNLTCVGDMLGGPVMCFRWVRPRAASFPQSRVIPDPPRYYDLLANVEDMVDTWGPGMLTKVVGGKGPEVTGIHLGGGINLCSR